MNNTKKLGIWMDHSSANLMELKDGSVNTKTIESTFSHEDKQEAKSRSEYTMHNKEQQQHEAYYKQIGTEILNYQNVLLFGPTKAKTELQNMLKSDLAFKDINIETKDADKMTDNQQQAFVKEYFAG